MAHCGRCGAVLGEGKKFCGGCGAPVVATAAPVAPVAVPGGKSAAVPVIWVGGAIAAVALIGAGTWLAYPVLLKRFRPETPVVATAPVPVQAPVEPPSTAIPPPAPEPGKEPEVPAVQPPVTVAPPVDRGDGGREAEARRNAERLAAERAASERAAAERAAGERVAAERVADERAASERLASERAAAERAAQERVAAERAEQARLAREAEEKQQAARRAAAAGPRSGVLTWQGRLVKGEVVTITGTSASTGEVSGVALPGGAVLLQSGSGCTVSSAPVPSSGFKQFSFRCKQTGTVTAEFQWNKP